MSEHGQGDVSQQNGASTGSGKPPKDKTEKRKYLISLKMITDLPSIKPVPVPEPLPPPLSQKAYDYAEATLKESIVARDKLEKELLEGAANTQSVSDFNGFSNVEARHRQAKAFKTALDSVQTVMKPFEGLVSIAKLGTDGARKAEESGVENVVPTSKQWQELSQKTIIARTSLRANGLPDGYQVPEGAWFEILSKQLEPYTQGKDAQENETLRADFRKNAPTKQNTDDAELAGEAIKGIIGKYQVRDMNRASIFFDAGINGVPMTQDEQKQAQAEMDKLAQIGSDILNNGGTYKQVKTMMAASGLTEEFWPPQLVQSIQAWRKTTRALQDERVRKIVENQQSGSGGFSTDSVMQAMQLIASGTELKSSINELNKPDESDKSGLLDAAAKSTEVGKTVADWLNGAASGVSGSLSVLELLESGKDLFKVVTDENKDARDKFLESLEISLDALAQSLGGVVAGLNMAKDFGGTAVTELMKKVVPGVCVAAAGVELAIALKDLGKNVATLKNTRSEKNEGYAQFLTDGVDEATLGVMSNALSAERTKVVKSGIKTGTATIELGAALSNTFGGAHGAAAGAGLSVVAGAINLGSKVIFTGIDWGKAKKAKKMLDEARAGNMQAQVEIFEKSNFYAKMYLAILVKAESPLAKKYLVDRGIEEGDLDKPQSLEILRDVMLEAADQVNDQEVDDNLARALTGKVGDFAAWTGNKTIELKDRAVRLGVAEYDPKANYAAPTFKDVAPDKWVSTWTAGKKILVERGLIDEATGITKALEKAAAACKLVADQQKDTKILPQEKRTALLGAIEALNAALECAAGSKPMAFVSTGSPKKIPHQKACDTLYTLQDRLLTELNAHWAILDNLAPSDLNWAPAKIDEIDLKAWQGFWTEGKDKASFPAKDCGVGKGIEAVVKAQKAFMDERDDLILRRQLAVQAFDIVTNLDDALLDCLALEELNRRPPAKDAITPLMFKLNEAQRLLDGWLAGKTSDGKQDAWKGPTPTFAGMELDKILDEWVAVYSYADDAGFLASAEETGKSDVDAGFTNALQAFGGSYKAFDNAGKDAKERLKALRAMEIDAGRVKKLAIKFGRTQRHGSTQVKAYAEAAAERIATEVVDLAKKEKDVTDKVDLKFTPKINGRGTLSSADWRNFYQLAVDNGVVLESGTAKKGLSAALQAQRKAQEEYDKFAQHLSASKKADKGKRIRVLATTYLEALHATVGTAEMIRGLKRYGESKQMGHYLKEVIEAVEKAETTELKDHASGKATAKGTQFPKPTTLSASDWTRQKDFAVEKGIVADKKTGITAAITAYLKVATLPDVQVGKMDPKKQEAVEELKSLLEAARDASKYKDWHDYVEETIALVV